MAVATIASIRQDIKAGTVGPLYLLQGEDEIEKAAIAHEFEGVHDFSGYARKDKRNPMRKIDSIEITDSGMFYSIDFRAESFLWNMVRRKAVGFS